MVKPLQIIPKTSEPELSGERFSVLYRLSGDEKQALDKAKDITLEQTVEFPDDLVPDGAIRNEILGRIESFERKDNNSYEALISFANEIAGDDINLGIRRGQEILDLCEGAMDIGKVDNLHGYGFRGRDGTIITQTAPDG